MTSNSDLDSVGIPTFSLANGVQMPVLGLGTYPMNNKEVPNAIRSAHAIGYTLFDTSSSYENEKGVGKALEPTDFVTTKISNRDQKSNSVERGFLKSRRKLHRKQIDLLLLHWPYPDKYLESWKVLEELYLEGKCRAIGVANFHQHHLEKLIAHAEIKPMVNQIELHPLLSQVDLVKFCKENDILVEAYSPFARMDKRLIENEVLLSLAEKHGKKVTQIILRWNYQNGIVSIPKTSSSVRMRENASIFDFVLSSEDMCLIESQNAGLRVRFDPDNCNFDIL